MSSNHTHAARIGGAGEFAMLAGAVTVLRLVWPYLREVCFGRASTKAWFKKNGLTLVWLLFIILMLGVVLKLVNIVNSEGHENATLRSQNADLLKKIRQDVVPVCRQVVPTVAPLSTAHRPTEPPPAPKSPNNDSQAILNELRQIKSDEEQ